MSRGLGDVYKRQPFIFYTAAIILYLVITRLSNILFDKAENTYSKGFVSKGAL